MRKRKIERGWGGIKRGREGEGGSKGGREGGRKGGRGREEVREGGREGGTGGRGREREREWCVYLSVSSRLFVCVLVGAVPDAVTRCTDKII